MSKYLHHISKKAGLAPGTLVYVGKKFNDKTKIEQIDYTESDFEEQKVERIDDCFPFKKEPRVTWLNITGIHDVDIVDAIGRHFDFHPLMLEDIVNANQRTKVEDFEKYLFIVLKLPYYDPEKNEIQIEQVSLIIGPNYVISFQEREGNIFESVKHRIKKNGRIRKLGSDYLAYSLIDSVIDNYFVILERIGESIEGIEDEVLKNPSAKILGIVHGLKRELIYLRKSAWPLRDVVTTMHRGDFSQFQKTTSLYLRDVHDHTIQVIDIIEIFNDITSTMIEIYLSSINNKMNEVIKELTVISTIFIPLSFIVGIYGMNFKYMPEINWVFSYPLLWLLMIALVIGMVMHFKKRKWL